jgi:subtilisin family serine protease
MEFTAYVDVTRNLPAGDVWFWYWVSSEDGSDSLNIYLDGVFQYPLSGCFPQTTAVGYPASHPDVIGVGASTDFDYRADFSQYGTNLSLVAPGGGGWGGIYTTDRTRTDGYNSGDYDSGFGGTSASSPIAAGVGALVLSVNPTLTAKEVRKILQDSCDKIGGVTYTNGWHPYYGYGRVNAQAALALALPKITSARITTNDVRVRFNSLTNRIYQLQRRDSLNASSAWTNVSSATNVVGNGVEAEAVDAGGYSQNTRFYRVRQLP